MFSASARACAIRSVRVSITAGDENLRDIIAPLQDMSFFLFSSALKKEANVMASPPMSHTHVRLEGGGGKSAKREPITSTIPGTVSFLKESAPKKKQKDGGVEITRNVAFDVLPENPSILPFDDAAHIVGVQVYIESSSSAGEEKKHNETWRGGTQPRKHSHRIVVGTRISANRRRLEATMRTYHCGKCGKTCTPPPKIMDSGTM